MKLVRAAAAAAAASLVPAVALACPASANACGSGSGGLAPYLAALGVGLLVGVGSIRFESFFRRK